MDITPIRDVWSSYRTHGAARPHACVLLLLLLVYAVELGRAGAWTLFYVISYNELSLCMHVRGWVGVCSRLTRAAKLYTRSTRASSMQELQRQSTLQTSALYRVWNVRISKTHNKNYLIKFSFSRVHTFHYSFE
uniref:Secreted protein n=1 Tax=Trichogramma kaykai TaxID=54128 RepID=A0ABD2VUS7_9HYME